MYLAAVVLALSSAVFYAAGHHEIGGFGADVCRYGGAFCENPTYVLAGAGLAAHGHGRAREIRHSPLAPLGGKAAYAVVVRWGAPQAQARRSR